MKRTLSTIGFLALLILSCASNVKADGVTLTYTLTEQGSNTPFATWTMPQDFTPTCPVSPCFFTGIAFAENISDLSIMGGPATDDTLVFFNTAGTTNIVDLNDVGNGSIFLLPEFLGAQLYTGDESAPHLSIGSFQLTNDGDGATGLGQIFDLTVTSAAVPEPASLLLLGTGLLALGFGLRKRRPRPNTPPASAPR
jgi:PEP-CTERM motif